MSQATTRSTARLAAGAQLVSQVFVASRVLRRELGFLRSTRVLMTVAAAELRSEPFGELPAAANERERLSRAQIAPAILLYRALRPVVGDRALEVARAVVVEAGVAFVAQAMRGAEPRELASLAPLEQAARVAEIGDRFFNATMRWDRVDSEGVDFTVTACHFPPLCAAVGVPELAPVFCAVDHHYFGGGGSDSVLERPQTIADGDESCIFRIRSASASAQSSAGVVPLQVNGRRNPDSPS